MATNLRHVCPKRQTTHAAMYQYTDFDRQFVHLRAAQFRDQLERWQTGKLIGGRVPPAAPAKRLVCAALCADVARRRAVRRAVERASCACWPGSPANTTSPRPRSTSTPLETQGKLGTHKLPTHYAHFTTRQNVQYNWIPLSKSADVMDLLASVNMHGIQTSGNCIRNITSDERAGIAVDEIADPRPFAEIMRQWSTLHPEFAFLPRKFKIAITGATEDRAATGWHDVGLHLVKNEAGELGFRVQVGGGMGRTPIIGTVLREFLPWNQIMNYLEAVIRVYNRYGRRDNIYKARIKILVKAEGQRYIDDVEAEYKQIIEHDGAPHTITQAELDRVSRLLRAADAGDPRVSQRRSRPTPT